MGCYVSMWSNFSSTKKNVTESELHFPYELWGFFCLFLGLFFFFLVCLIFKDVQALVKLLGWMQEWLFINKAL